MPVSANTDASVLAENIDIYTYIYLFLSYSVTIDASDSTVITYV
jgi:hypothetical protein